MGGRLFSLGFLLLFLAKIALAENIVVNEDVLDAALDDIITDANEDAEEAIELKEVNLKKTIAHIKSNFADKDEQNLQIFSAAIEAYKNRVYNDLQIDAKFSMKKGFKITKNKTKDILKDGWGIAKDIGKDLAKEAWEGTKHVAKHCINETLKELKTLPKILGTRFLICAEGKITDGIEFISEEVDLSTLPLSTEDMQARMDKCLASSQSNALACISGVFEEIFSTLGTEVDDGTGPKMVITKLLADVVSCGDFKDMMNTSVNVAVNAPIKCLLDLVANGFPTTPKP